MQEKKLWKTNYKEFMPEDTVKDTIIILHGWWWSSDSWIQVGEILENNNYRVLVPDLPWFWKTPLEKIFTLDDYKDFVINFCKKLNINNFILWGHSNWWAISIKVANAKKLDLKLLVLNNSAWIRDDKKRNKKRSVITTVSKPLKFLWNNKVWQKARTLFYKAIWSNDYLEAEKIPFLKETYLNMISSDLKEEIKQIDDYTFLIWWEKDTYTPLSDWEFMSKNIKKSRLDVLDWEKHGIHLQNPQRLTRTFFSYINSNLL